MKRKLFIAVAFLFAMLLPTYANAALSEDFLYGEWKIIIEGWEDLEFGKYTFNVDGKGSFYVNNYSKKENLPFSWSVSGNNLNIKYDDGRESSERVTVKDNDHIVIDGDEYTRIAQYAKTEVSESDYNEPEEAKPAPKVKAEKKAKSKAEKTAPKAETATPVSKDFITGKWESQSAVTYFFKADGTGFLLNNGSNYKFNWSVDGSNIVMSYKEGKEETVTVEILDDNNIKIDGVEFTRTSGRSSSAAKSEPKAEKKAESEAKEEETVVSAPASATSTSYHHRSAKTDDYTNIYNILTHPLGLTDAIAGCSMAKFESHLKATCKFKALKDAIGGTFFVESSAPVVIGDVKLVVKYVTYDEKSVQVNYSLADSSLGKKTAAQKLAKALSDAGFTKTAWPGYEVYEAFSTKNNDKIVIELSDSKLTLSTYFRKK